MPRIPSMATILFITDLISGSRLPRLAGGREAAAERGWHVEEVELARLEEPLESVLAYWQPRRASAPRSTRPIRSMRVRPQVGQEMMFTPSF